jgi:hypothetical protein
MYYDGLSNIGRIECLQFTVKYPIDLDYYIIKNLYQFNKAEGSEGKI